jgi:hypothetical protein
MSKGKIGSLEYSIHDVKGDGHCFYRAIYNLLQDSKKGKDELDLNDVDEYEGVENIRYYIGKMLKENWDQDAIDSIHLLCDEVLKDADEDLFEQIQELYPFVDTKFCSKKKPKRIDYVAEKIENMEDPMYASEIEKDIIKRALESVDNLFIAVITSDNQDTRTLTRKWKKDLLGLLQNSTKAKVAVLLNMGNIHYKYLTFKMDNTENYHTIINRIQAINLLNNIKHSNSPTTSQGGKLKLKKKLIKK